MSQTVRINKYIAMSTGVSRRKAEDSVRAGHIKINNKTVYNLAEQVAVGEDVVTLNNKVITPRNVVYYALNKPVGVTSTRFDPFAEKKITDYVPQHPAVYPVGRLDKNSEGLILLTNDGYFAQKISSAGSHIEKEYQVHARTVKEGWDVRQLKKLESFTRIGNDTMKADSVFGWKHDGNNVSFYIILTQGKNRQIRRMAQKIGLEVMKLKRVRVGKLKLGGLAEGKYTKITPDDVLI